MIGSFTMPAVLPAYMIQQHDIQQACERLVGWSDSRMNWVSTKSGVLWAQHLISPNKVPPKALFCLMVSHSWTTYPSRKKTDREKTDREKARILGEYLTWEITQGSYIEPML